MLFDILTMRGDRWDIPEELVTSIEVDQVQVCQWYAFVIDGWYLVKDGGMD